MCWRVWCRLCVAAYVAGYVLRGVCCRVSNTCLATYFATGTLQHTFCNTCLAAGTLQQAPCGRCLAHIPCNSTLHHVLPHTLHHMPYYATRAATPHTLQEHLAQILCKTHGVAHIHTRTHVHMHKTLHTHIHTMRAAHTRALAPVGAPANALTSRRQRTHIALSTPRHRVLQLSKDTLYIPWRRRVPYILHLVRQDLMPSRRPCQRTHIASSTPRCTGVLWSRHAIDSLYHGDGLYHIYYLAYANTHLGVLVLEYTKIWWSIAVE